MDDSQKQKVNSFYKFLGLIYGVAIFYLRVNPKYHFVFELLTGIPIGLMFIYAHYLFFFDKDRKNPKVKSVLWKVLLASYALLVAIVIFGH